MNINDLKDRLEKVKEGNGNITDVLGEIKKVDLDNQIVLVDNVLNFFLNDYFEKAILAGNYSNVEEYEDALSFLRGQIKDNCDLSDERIDELFSKNSLNSSLYERLITDRENKINPDIIVEEVKEETQKVDNTLDTEVTKLGEDTVVKVSDSDSDDSVSDTNLEEKVEEVNENAEIVVSEEVVEELKKEDEAIELLNNEIKSLEEELEDVKKEANEAGLNLSDYLETEINKLETKKSDEIKNFNSEISLYLTELNDRKTKSFIENTKGVPYYQLSWEVSELREELDKAEGNRINELNEEIAMYDAEILRRYYSTLSDSFIENKVETLKNELKTLSPDSLEYSEKKKEVFQFEKELVRRRHSRLFDKLNYKELIREIEHLEGMLKIKQPGTEQYIKLYNELEYCKARLRKSSFSIMSDEDLKNKIAELENNKKSIQSEIDKLVEDLKAKQRKVERLEELKLELAEQEKKKNSSKVEHEVGPVSPVEHEVGPFKPEVVDAEVKEVEKPEDKKIDDSEVKLIENKKNRKDLMWKALAGVAGLGAGFALSFVPGVGQIRMGIAAAKLGINVATKFFPESKIAKIIDSKNKKFDKMMISFAEKCPGISSKIKKIREVVPEGTLNWFINGVSIGYIAGNIYEMYKVPESVAVTDPKPTPEPKPVITPEFPKVDIEPGKVFDISGIKEGYTFSGSGKTVSLATKYGKEAIVDKLVTKPDGSVWVSFNSMDGDPYAWFKLSDVEKYLGKAADLVSKSGKTL